VFVVDRLHAKLYWVEGVGYVVASANLSTNALGGVGLHEVGVFVDKANQVDIDALLRNLNAKPLQHSHLEKLQVEHDRFWAANKRRPKLKSAKRTFAEWYHGARLPKWKLAWWDAWGREHKSTVTAVRTLFGVDAIDDFIPCSEHEIDPGDWVLCYFVTKNGAVSEVAWLYADHVHKLTKTESREEGFTHEAVQLRPPRAPMRPPFSLTSPGFLPAFRDTLKVYGLFELKTLVRPPAPFLRVLNARLSSKPLEPVTRARSSSAIR
jgi:hypothetical protein